MGEDLRRGRTYLPDEDLAAFGVDREMLALPHPTDQVRSLLRFEIDRTRELYRAARPGIEMLHPTSREAIGTAFVLYGEILDAVEHADLDVLHRRVGVPLGRTPARACSPCPT